MVDVVAIEASWLAIYAPQMCNLSSPLLEPPPFYDEKDDCVMAFVSGTFGSHLWPLPVTAIPFPECEDRYKWFAYFLLVGQVDRRLLPFVSSLLSHPRILFKSWIRLQPAMLTIVQRLSSRCIASRKLLLREWTADPDCEYSILSFVPIDNILRLDLISELKTWFPENMHHKLNEGLRN